MISFTLRSLRGVVTRLSPGTYNYSPLNLNTNSNSDSPSTGEASAAAATVSPSLSARISAILFFLLPSFVQRSLRPHSFKPRRLYPTSWLDGLRGVASLIVFFCHYTEGNLGSYIQPYGIRDENDKVPSSPLQLPFVRVVYSGRPMVHIFFIISGFVLSHKSLKLLRRREYDNLHKTLASSIFRRAFRLFLPTTASTFIIMILIRTRWMGTPLPTFWEQLVDWYNAVWRITYSWNWDITQALPYDIHLWTIPIEMSHSMLLFVTLTGLSRLKTYVRLVVLFAIMIYCLKCGHWAAFEFLAGMGIAEIGMIQEARSQRETEPYNKESEPSDLEIAEPSKPRTAKSSATRLFQIFLIFNLIFALFTAGWPNVNADKTPGIATLRSITMEPFFGIGGDLISFAWFALGAVQVVVALQQIQFLQNIFTTPVAQYLADISYALYLCHGPVLDVFAHRWMPNIWSLVGGPENAGMWGRMFVWFMGILALGVPTIWSSDVFWRTIDVKSVEFARWFESVCVRD
jgi:peptidoglycan/LPS O-acetylase OafA/YrhL